MFISPAYAQAAGGGGSGIEAMLPLVLIFIVFYFLLIRPQQKKMKEHKVMLASVNRGDRVVTGGGISGKVTKVDNEHEITVEIAKDVRVKVQRSLLSAVLSKTQPQKGAAPANENQNQSGGGGFLGKLFGVGGGQQSNPASSQGSVPASGGDVEVNEGDAQVDADDSATDEKKQ